MSYQIAFDAKRAFHNASGLGNYSRVMIQSLAQAFPENVYHLYTPSYRPSDRSSFAQGLENVQVHTPEHSLQPAWLWRSIGVGGQLKQGKMDLFHGLSAELPVRLPVPGLVTVHDLIFLRFPQYYQPADRMIYAHKHKSACVRAQRVHAISKQTADDLVHFLRVPARKIEVILQSCHPQFYQEVDEAARLDLLRRLELDAFPFILNVGTIEPRKNLLSIVEALPQMDPSLHLVVLGRRTPYARMVDEAIARLGLSQRVHFFHNMDFACFPALYRSALAVVYPSMFEGFGLPVLEALAAGVPVLTSKVSSMPEAGASAALYVNPLQADDIAWHVNQLFRDASLRRRCVEKGLRHAAEHSPEKVAARMMELYTSLL